MKSYGVTIQMKATEHYYAVQGRSKLMFESVDEIQW